MKYTNLGGESVKLASEDFVF